jgi:hypothetical protein
MTADWHPNQPDAYPSLDDRARIHIRKGANWAAHKLTRSQPRVPRVELTPGDMTAYRIAVIPPGYLWHGVTWLGPDEEAEFLLHDYWVTLQGMGHGYPWRPGGFVHPTYAADKWTCPRDPAGTRVHTGEVLAYFPNALDAALSESPRVNATENGR